jgi:hypothetical protein
VAEYMLVDARDRVLSRLASAPGDAPRSMFWMWGPTAEATGYRMAVRFPSEVAADRAADVYQATPRVIP